MSLCVNKVFSQQRAKKSVKLLPLKLRSHPDELHENILQLYMNQIKYTRFVILNGKPDDKCECCFEK